MKRFFKTAKSSFQIPLSVFRLPIQLPQELLPSFSEKKKPEKNERRQTGSENQMPKRKKMFFFGVAVCIRVFVNCEVYVCARQRKNVLV